MLVELRDGRAPVGVAEAADLHRVAHHRELPPAVRRGGQHLAVVQLRVFQGLGYVVHRPARAASNLPVRCGASQGTVGSMSVVRCLAEPPGPKPEPKRPDRTSRNTAMQP